MLSRLDPVIFPDRCEVLEIVPHKRYVYPMFKNGSTSLERMGYRTLELSELAELDKVEIFVREPWQRYLSGVQSFLDWNPNLDKKTALWFINEYPFLNRHFCPQFYWVINLARFTRADTKIQINDISKLHEVTLYTDNPTPNKPDIVDFDSPLARSYLQLDTVLTKKLLNRSVTASTIMAGIRFEYPSEYGELIQRSKDLCAALDTITS